MTTDFPLCVYFSPPELLVLLARTCWLIIFFRFKKKKVIYTNIYGLSKKERNVKL